MADGQVITTYDLVTQADQFTVLKDRGIGLEGPFRIAAADASAQLATLLPMSVKSRASTSPPETPADGDRYIVAAAATGAWEGHDGQIARYRNAAWDFTAPIDGLLVHVVDENVHVYYRLATTAWVQVATGPTGPAPWAPLVAWAPSTVYTATAPASTVNFSGASYVCNTSHTSGATFAADSAKWTQIATGGGNPSGSTGAVQYNNAGAFGAVTGFSFDGTKLTLTKRIEQGMTANVDGIAIGVGAGANLTGAGTVAIGKDALATATTSANIIAIGKNALKAATSAVSSIAIGTDALTADTIGNNSVAIGRSTLKAANPSYNNIAIGDQALTALTTGTSNVAIGVLALKSATTGGSNVAIGTSSGQALTTGGSNVSIGNSAALSETTGSYNVVVGDSAGYFSVGNLDAVLIGYQAGYNATGIFASVGIGFGALRAENSAYPTNLSQNVAIGYTAMYSTTTGSINTAVGTHALKNNTTGSSNVAVGVFAAQQCTTVSYNTAIGAAALGNCITGEKNTCVGANAGINATGSYVTAIGMSAFNNLTSGANNTALGYNTGLGITTGSNNTIIGAGVSGLSAGLTGAIVIATGDGVKQAEFNVTDSGGWLFNAPVRPKSYTVAGLPAGIEGQIAYATNGRKVGEGAGSGTGVPVYFADGSWRVFSTDAAVAA